MTQLKTTQNTTDEKPDEFTLKIEEILKLRLSPDLDTSSMKKQILDVLHGDKQKALFLLGADPELYQYLPDVLRNDEDIVSQLVSQKPEKYRFLALKYKQNIKIQELTVSAIISSGGDVLDLIEVLKVSKKGNKKLQTLVSQLLEKYPSFLKHTESRLIYAIFISERKIFDIFIEKGLIFSSHSGISLGSKAAAFLAKILSELESESPDETQSKLIGALLTFLGLAENTLGESSGKLIELLVSQVAITQKTQDHEEEKGAADIEDDQEIINQEEDDADIYASAGPYNYIPLGNSCRVWDNLGSSVVIEKKEFESMNEKSLENFMNFSKLMKHLGLDFLISKQHRLSQLVTGVNFYQGEGMSEARTLRFLNSVGKNIGVPEQSYEDNDGNKKTGYFRSLGAAKMHFGEVRDSGKIGGLDVDISTRGDKSIVEIYMKHRGLLVEPFGEISVAKWR